MTGRKTLTVEEAARELGIGRGLAYEAARTGAIPAVRVGRRLLVPRAALDRLLTFEQPLGTTEATRRRPRREEVPAS